MVSLLTPIPPGPALPVLPSQAVGATFPSVITGVRKGQLSHSSDLRDGSPTWDRPQRVWGVFLLPNHPMVGEVYVSVSHTHVLRAGEHLHQ